MPRRDTMHPRNSAVLPIVLFLFLFVSLAAAQSDAFPSAVPPAAPAPAPKPATQNEAQKQDPKSPDATRNSADTQNNSPAQNNQKPSPDEGGFVFHKEVDEVVLHATVVDDKQHIVTTPAKQALTRLADGKP